MTKRHFEAIAAEFKAKFEEADSFAPAEGFDAGHTAGYLNALTEIAEAMADVFLEANPRFLRDKFLAACGL